MGNNKKKILIVEDDEMLIEIYKKKFEKEYDLKIVSNGKEAIETAKEMQPELILLDLIMPEMDGFEALEKLKSEPATKNINVIVASNVSQDNDRERAKKLGALDFIVKSNFDLNELADRIQSYL